MGVADHEARADGCQGSGNTPQYRADLAALTLCGFDAHRIKGLWFDDDDDDDPYPYRVYHAGDKCVKVVETGSLEEEILRHLQKHPEARAAELLDVVALGAGQCVLVMPKYDTSCMGMEWTTSDIVQLVRSYIEVTSTWCVEYWVTRVRRRLRHGTALVCSTATSSQPTWRAKARRPSSWMREVRLGDRGVMV